MKRGIFYDYGNGSADLVIDKLKNEGIMDTLIWIDNTELFNLNCNKANRVPMRTPDYDWFDLRESKINTYEYSSSFQNHKEDFYKDFYEFVIKAGREDIKAHANMHRSEDYHLYSNSSVYAMQNIFFILSDFFTKMLIDNKIEVIYYNFIPHEGADYILYLRAKALNIKTIIATHNVIFTNKFLYTYDINEYGNFDILPTINENIDYKISPENEDAPSYAIFNTEFILEDNDLDPYIKERFFDKKVKFNFKTFRKKIRKNLKLALNLIQLDPEIKKNRFKELGRFASNALIYCNFMKYKSDLDASTCAEFNLDKKFVYFPLHYQPESTTSAFAGIFNDQLLALEKISSLIPDDWLIYAKEHYPQREWMRDPIFFKRLNGIKKVKLIPKTNTSTKLIKNAQFVSTITGTVGWETLNAGKKVLIFGKAWYLNLPGVFLYNEQFQLSDIVDYQVDLQFLEKRIGEMHSKFGNGLLDCDCIPLVPNYDKEQNLNSIVESLKKIL